MDAKSELACTYATLILTDDGIEVTADKLNTLLKAANCKFVEPYVTSLFANALSGHNIRGFFASAASTVAAPAPAAGGQAPAAGGAPAASAAAAAAAPAKKEEEEKKEESEESDEDMGFNLFD
ncbi:unnamed protein product [Mesocestoides corti]|uniref:Large ribosomal subunit protein P1 n=1 Tax=Mesocestoides corti TaxID=53468 RepID=A0A0R3U6A1_MESCO|nr:unnamed protein product [Mesocestoides corti]